MLRKGFWVLFFVLVLLGLPAVATADPGADDRFPVWSPDGRQLAFVSNRDGNNEIYVMAADGSNIHNVSHSPLNDISPAWSPDSQQLVFVRESVSGKRYSTLHRVDADSGNLETLTPTLIDILKPQWSPDGTAILVAAAVQSAKIYNLYLIQPETGRMRKLTETEGRFGTWSPDGQWIAFLPHHQAHTRVQWQLVNLASGEITDLLEQYWFPYQDCCTLIWDWAPDSQRIAFSLQGDGNLYTVEIKTGYIRPLAYVGGLVGGLAWSTDGQQIIFTVGDLPTAQFHGGAKGLFIVYTISGNVRLIHRDIIKPFFKAAPNRQQLFMASGPQVRLYRLDGEMVILEPKYTNQYDLVWSPDNRFIAASLCVDGDADIYILDVEAATAQNLTDEDDFSGTAEPSSCAGIG